MTNTPHSPSGKMSRARTAAQWALILGPCLKRSQTAKFLCLIGTSGRQPEWYRTLTPKSLGDAWTPNISEAPNHEEGYFLWQIIEANVPEKYFLTPNLCTKYLELAHRADCRFPQELETILLKQGGIMPKYDVSTTGK